MLRQGIADYSRRTLGDKDGCEAEQDQQPHHGEGGTTGEVQRDREPTPSREVSGHAREGKRAMGPFPCWNGTWHNGGRHSKCTSIRCGGNGCFG
jgi:hypothetical protein